MHRQLLALPSAPSFCFNNLSVAVLIDESLTCVGLSQHNCEACGQPLLAKKTPYCSGKTQTLHTFNQTLTTIIICIFNYCAYIWIRTYYVSLTMHIYIGTSLYGTKLIRTRTEPLGNKQVFIEH